MTEEAILPTMPERMPLAAVLGFSDPNDGDWGRVRALQCERYTKYAFARNIAHFASALLVCQAYFGDAPAIIIIGWLLLLGGSLVVASRYFNAQNSIQNRVVSALETRRIAMGALLPGLAWLSAVFVLPPYGGLGQLLTLWTVCATLMVGAALLLSSLPLGGILFISLIGFAFVGVFISANEFTLAAVACGYSMLLILGMLENARDYLRFRVTEVGLSEKSEVVSLLLREFEESGADWLWQIDTSRRVVHASPRFAYALGRDAQEIEGQSLIQLIAGEAWETGKFSSSLHDLAEKLKRRESFSNLLVRVTIGNDIRWWELSASPKLDDNGVFLGFRGVGSDVTEQRESAEKIAHLARFDTLTGLPNRLQLTEALGKAIQDTQQWQSRCAFLMIDLDRFKSVNDTLGHLVGDRLLAQVSKRLSCLMTDNEMCGRLGGDEFAVIIKDVRDNRRIEQLSQQIIDTLSRPYDVDQHTIFVGASVGSAVGPRDGRTVEMLIRSADLALYRSKDEGGSSHHCYEPKLHVHAEERRIMEIALRNALDKDEFTLNYQPVVAAKSEAIVGFEALLRWHNSELGHVSPGKFIPLAEEARLIVPIGAWVLRKACEEAMNWPSSVKISVNVSAEQLNVPEFVPLLAKTLSETGLHPQRLDIEVTESIFLREGAMAVDALDQILALGVGLSLDDFGTGYSSLGYLRKTRFTNIKVDRSFVQGAAQNAPESLAIVRAVVAMADSLGMSTTAEGTETEEEVAMIKNLGCKKIQGYYYGRPMLAEDVRKLFRTPSQMQA